MAKMSASEEKMLMLQHHMRENNMDLESFVKDMNKWEDDIKEKEKKLKSEKSLKEKDLPPVRNSLKIKKKRRVPPQQHEGKSEERKPRKRISGYDYRAWDKLDIDKLCDDVEIEEKSDSSEYETDEEWEVERKKQQAAMEKDSGNEYFKRGDYTNAIESYTKGMGLDPTNPILPANRAMALLKEQKYAAAEMDCMTALTLDPLYVKAYLRLGSAQYFMKKFHKAKETFEKVLQLEAQNKQAKLEIEKIEKEMKKEQMVAPDSSAPDAGLVKPITKPPNKRSKKPLRRLDIEEIGIEETDTRQAARSRVEESHSQQRIETESKDNQMFAKFTTPGMINARSTPQTLKESKPVISNDNSAKSQSDTKLDLSSVQNGTKASVSPRSEGKSLSPRSFPVPASSFQFQSDYKVLKNDTSSFYDYLKMIDPTLYPKLFGECLDAEILMKMLKVFQNFYKPTASLGYNLSNQYANISM
ncbi:RNA polymerase II-associated protein 3-like isoform X2 [Ostrea edulis]|uniref:RNA polymerase II-associated protein 3-like isoform X2 n=1 Tax=Ostrea edulis TaxID=37623 RepID=UPI0024AED52B|nr:RNA polymerase II-associated protein 3-like isoform X2 [Ostrea edulis]